MKKTAAVRSSREKSFLKLFPGAVNCRPGRLWSCLLFFLATTTFRFSQGYVAFENFVLFNTVDPTGGNRRVYDVGSPLNPTTGTGLTGTQWVAELYAGTSVASLAPVTASIS